MSFYVVLATGSAFRESAVKLNKMNSPDKGPEPLSVGLKV